MPNPIKCFVASAFDKADVDRIFDKAIRPVLRELGIQPLRVDRVEHNDDIDDKIFQLLDEADLCIADLTYARPSVYFEAGYASASKKPVVYIAREDHFYDKVDDKPGNLRVHFDLRMKNIIPWKDANQGFRSRLKKRLQKTIQPIIVERTASEINTEQANRFRALPHLQQLDEIVVNGRDMLQRRRFKPVNMSHRVQLENCVTLWRIAKNTYEEVSIAARHSLTKQDLRLLQLHTRLNHLNRKNNSVTKCENTLVVATLRPMLEQTLARWLFEYHRVSEKAFGLASELNRFTKLPTINLIFLVDAIKSTEQFSERLADII